MATYSAGFAATSRSRPNVVRMLAPTRAACRLPRSVITGTPIHKASQVVAVPL